MEIKRSNLDVIRNEINQAMVVLGEKLGLNIHAGHCSYDSAGRYCRFKLECTAIKPDGKAVDMLEENFKVFAQLEGLSPSDLHRTFIMHNGTFEIVGYKSRARKNPIVIRDVKTNKRFVTNASTVLSKLHTLAPNVPA